MLQALHHLVVEPETGLSRRKHPGGNERVDDVRLVDNRLWNLECACENVQVEFRIVEDEGARRFIARNSAGVIVCGGCGVGEKCAEPLLRLIEVEIATFACGQRKSDFIRMRDGDVVALRDLAVVAGRGEADAHQVALHRVEPVGFGIHANQRRCSEFRFHLLEDFFGVDTNVWRRNIDCEVRAFHYCAR